MKISIHIKVNADKSQPGGEATMDFEVTAKEWNEMMQDYIRNIPMIVDLLKGLEQ